MGGIPGASGGALLGPGPSLVPARRCCPPLLKEQKWGRKALVSLGVPEALVLAKLVEGKAPPFGSTPGASAAPSNGPCEMAGPTQTDASTKMVLHNAKRSGASLATRSRTEDLGIPASEAGVGQWGNEPTTVPRSAN